MPRITAPTVREHVARQERAILDAAADLFAERGVAGTDLADIAHAVGLARSSLYRYFPDKDHILAAWFTREIEPVVRDVERIEGRDAPAIIRIDAWIDANLDWVGRPGGEVLPRLLAQLGAVSADVRNAIAEAEDRLREPLRRLVAEAVRDVPADPAVALARDAGLVTELLLGAVDAGINAVARGVPSESVCNALGRVARSLLGDTGAPGAPTEAPRPVDLGGALPEAVVAAQ